MCTWNFEKLPDIISIQERLKLIFPKEVDINGYITREMGAKTIFVMLYCFCIDGKEWIRPATVTCMTDQQARCQEIEERISWLATNQSSKAPRDIPNRWYKSNTREPIRDETIRELVRLNAIIERSGLPTTSPLPRYSLHQQFAQLFDPNLTDEALSQAIQEWHKNFLSQNALARTALLKRLVTASTDGILINLPNGETRKMANGPSSVLTKAVVEEFTKNFMKDPAVVLISESSQKLLMKDDELCQAIGFHVDVGTVLPDLILVELGIQTPKIVFVECVASDGPINDRRKQELLDLIHQAGYEEDDCAFVTVFRDRSDTVSRRLVPSIAWGTFIWHVSEPCNIIYLHSANGKQNNPFEMF